jgi:hypothetical protein
VSLAVPSNVPVVPLDHGALIIRPTQH